MSCTAPHVHVHDCRAGKCPRNRSSYRNQVQGKASARHLLLKIALEDHLKRGAGVRAQLKMEVQAPWAEANAVLPDEFWLRLGNDPESDSINLDLARQAAKNLPTEELVQLQRALAAHRRCVARLEHQSSAQNAHGSSPLSWIPLTQSTCSHAVPPPPRPSRSPQVPLERTDVQGAAAAAVPTIYVDSEVDSDATIVASLERQRRRRYRRLRAKAKERMRAKELQSDACEVYAAKNVAFGGALVPIETGISSARLNQNAGPGTRAATGDYNSDTVANELCEEISAVF